MPVAERVEARRIRGRPDVREFLSLGSTPIANALVAPPAPAAADQVHPLTVGFCTGCTLVQLTRVLPAEAIFDAGYPYYSSFSPMLVAHSAVNVDGLVRRRGLGAESFVVEIASNDGYLLRRVAHHGVRALGVEPSPGQAAAAQAAGVPTLEEFFDVAVAERIAAEHGRADVVIANNVLAHVPDLDGFVAGIAALLADGGVVSIENPGVRYLLEHVEFDTIYHEHVCYFSTIAMQRVLARHGLALLAVEHFPELHGGTLRWTAGRGGRPAPSVARFLAEERALGLDDLATYQRFGAQVLRNQAELTALLRRLRAAGATIAAYGAAAKGATLLNTTGIGRETIDFVVDRNVHKQGKLVPGVRLPILDPGALLERRPDYLLLLAWNFAAEIIGQQERYAQAGGRFIVPVPRQRVLGRDGA